VVSFTPLPLCPSPERASSKSINSISNKEEIPDQEKESLIVEIYKKSNKTD
jgi:hypothetical protein